MGAVDTSGISSSSVSELQYRDVGEAGKTCGRVGIQTGSDGLVDRLFLRWGKVGDVGDVDGVLRRTKVEMGIFAVRSVSDKVSFSGRREVSFRVYEDVRRLIVHVAGER